MTEQQSSWGVFFEEDSGRTYLVAVEQSQDEAIGTAWALDEKVALGHDFTEGLPNLHRVEAIPDKLAAETAEQLSRGEAVLVRAPSE